MRVGNNPNRFGRHDVNFPATLGAVITHLPHQREYHAGRLEVIKISLTTMRRAGIPILIWDNGSCGALRDWLREEFKPEYLILSGNVGKVFAKSAIFHMLPPSTMVAFSDDDILYYPHWLDAHMDIFRAFPNVGMVSGWPVRIAHNWGNTYTLEWAARFAKIERGLFISAEDERDYCLSVGLDYAEHSHRRDLEDIRITYGAYQAYAAAQHCQFVARAGAVAPYCEFASQVVKAEREFDVMVDAAGLLRLTTTQRYTLHMGNVIDGRLRDEIGRATNG